MHPIDIIEHINDCKTQKGKAGIIELYQRDAKLEKAVYMALNTELSFHTKAIKYDPPRVSIFGEASETGSVVGNFDKLMDKLLEVDAHGSCPANMQRHLSELYSVMPSKDRDLVDMILTRKIPCGAGLGKWRIGYGEEFLPDFPCYLSSAFDEAAIMEHIFKGAPYAFSEVKTDGQRCMAIVEDGKKIQMHSRNGKKYIGLKHMEHVINNHRKRGNFVVDGELVVMEEDGRIIPRAKGNGMISKFLKGKGTLDVSARVVFVVWDIIPLKEFRGKCMEEDKLPAHARKSIRDKWVKDITDVYDEIGEQSPIILQSGRKVHDIGEAMEHYAECVAKGEEGSILERFDAYWEPCPNKKRPNTQFKFKEEFEADFIVTGWEYGEAKGKYAKAIGKFNVQSSCGKVKFNCGGGLPDSLRFDKNPDRFIGRTMNCLFNALSESEKKDTYSVQHPRMSKWVDGEPNSLERILEQIEATRQMKRVMGK